MSNEKLLQSDISYLVTIIPELHTFYRPFFNIDGDNIAINTFPNYEKLGKYFAKENGLDISDYNILENYIDYEAFAKDMIDHSGPEYECYIKNHNNNRIYQFRKI